MDRLVSSADDDLAEISFQADTQVAEVAVTYWLQAIEVALSSFDITLDGTEASVEKVEWILRELHESKARTRPTEQTVWQFGMTFGSYVGEVLQRYHGGEWGTVTMGGKTFPGFRQPNGSLVWPTVRAQNRLVIGPSENIWDYYCALTGTIGPDTSSDDP
ncbi:MAG: hypothetical protein ACRCZF_10690 [Gemmataceae bacterium]